MPRTKSSTPEFITQLDRPPQRERLFGKIKESLDSIASFYGFEAIHVSPVEDSGMFAPLEKSGLFGARLFVSCRTGRGEDLILYPPAALAILRAYGSHKMNNLPHPLKLVFSADHCFFPAARDGGIEPHSSWGLMIIGEESPVSEAEIIHIVWKALEEINGLAAGAEVKINATGCGECRPAFRSAFLSYLRPRARRLCRNCRRHLKRVPTRILTCQEEKCKIIAGHSPQILDFLCEACKKHLRGLLEFLDEIRIPYSLDAKFFREGLWLEKAVFEIVLGGRAVSPEDSTMGRHLTVAEGGRASRAGEMILGKRIDAACITVFLDAIEKILLEKVAPYPEEVKPKVFFAQLGELAKKKSFGIIETLRFGGITVRESLGRDSIKSQLKVAERVGAEMALILGQKEALDNTVIVREIGSGIQETIPQEKLIEFLKRKLKK